MPVMLFRHMRFQWKISFELAHTVVTLDVIHVTEKKKISKHVRTVLVLFSQRFSVH